MQDRPLATRLTPVGRSAIASISVEGESALEVVEQNFVSASRLRLSQLDLGRIAFGYWGHDRGEEIVICRTRRGIEIHCHGGFAASNAILETLAPQVEIADAPEQWLAAEIPGEIEREAYRLLAETSTQPAASRMLSQFRGALRTKLGEIVIALRGADLHIASKQLSDLLSDATFGLHLTKAWRVVLNGPPNVGKSSLLNRILGYQRAVVFDQPGTTRDVVSAQSPLGGWQIAWSDTAGIRDATDDLEEQGILRALSAMDQADLVLQVIDVERYSPEHVEKAGYGDNNKLYVLNKIDSQPASYADEDAGQSAASGWLPVSAHSGQGIDALLEAIRDRLVGQAPADFAAPLLFTDAQVRLAQRAQESLLQQDRDAALEAMQELLR